VTTLTLKRIDQNIQEAHKAKLGATDEIDRELYANQEDIWLDARIEAMKKKNAVESR